MFQNHGCARPYRMGRDMGTPPVYSDSILDHIAILPHEVRGSETKGFATHLQWFAAEVSDWASGHDPRSKGRRSGDHCMMTLCHGKGGALPPITLRGRCQQGWFSKASFPERGCDFIKFSKNMVWFRSLDCFGCPCRLWDFPKIGYVFRVRLSLK